MALFTIADLHLSSDGSKSMSVFGPAWQNSTERIEANWRRLVTENDTVVLPGDISWALRLEETDADFALLDSLPGTKYLFKGNHDFWWTSLAKMNAYTFRKGFSTLRFLQNNAAECENYIIAGSRGWFLDEEQQKTVGTVDYAKIVNREVIRLRMSLEDAKKKSEETGKEILVFLHFPPVWGGYRCDEILALLKEFGIRRIWFGHLHGVTDGPKQFDYEGMECRLIASDALSFIPQHIQ